MIRAKSDKAASRSGDENRNVLQIARRVAATIGADFFRAIARHLAEALNADCVLIGEFMGGQAERVVTLGAWLDGQPANFDYELAGSASAQMALGKPCTCRADARTRYPSDTLLALLQAQACIGVPLKNARDQALGLMMAIYRRPVTALRDATTLLDIFSARAAAELSRKREEDQLRESEQRYRAFIALNVDAMWRVEFEDPIPVDLPEQEQYERIYRHGYLAECNDALARLLGYEKAENVIGSRLDEIAPRSEPSMREATLIAIRSGYKPTTIETAPVDRFGNRRNFVRSQWGIVENGALQRMWGTTRDVTALKRSESARHASERRMAEVMETVSLAVIVADPQGRITYCNKYLYEITGWRSGDTLGKDWVELMIPPEEQSHLRDLFAEAEVRMEPIHFVSTLLGPGGESWNFDWDRMLLRNPENQIVAWANVGRDVTEQRELEAQFRQSQKLATIGRVAGGVAHDFNNLLTVIMGYSAALLEKTESTDPYYTGLSEIRKAAGKGAELTHRLLAFSRRQVLHPEVVSLAALIADAEALLSRLIGDDVELTTDAAPSLGLVRIDPGSFHQVLMNLTVNARDAMPRGGRLSIATSNVTVETRGTFTPTVPPGEYVQVAVSDTGIGMSEDVLNHLFEPFFTTKEHGKGTGLGLSTVYGIVQQSGGRIVVETELGKGTIFRIFLPRVHESAQMLNEVNAQIGALMGTETILLVEDCDDVRELTARMLGDFGYNILVAETPRRAIELSQDRGRSMHLLLSDIVMPGTPGVELADQVKAYQPDIRVLFISGNADKSRIADKLAEPGFGYLEKPFTARQLAAKVRELLNA